MNTKMAINTEYLEFDCSDNENNESTYKSLSAAVGKNTILDGYCTKCSADGDLTIVCGDVTCIMERSEVTPVLESDGLVHKSTCQNKVGKHLKFRVIKKENDIFYVSRKDFINDIRKDYYKNLEVNQVVKGVITNIEEKIGCFVDIGADYTAILPKNKLEYVYVNNITDHVSIGDVIEAAITDVQKEDGEITAIALSRIQVLPSYEELTKDYAPGDIVIGKVNQITPKSIYTQLTKHLNIVCRLSPKVRVKVGQNVRIRLKRIGTESNKKLVGDIISVL